MELRVLGPLQVIVDGEEVDLGPPKQRALFAVLVLEANRVVPVDRAVDLLWGEDPPRTAVHSVQGYVSDLRRRLAGSGAAIVTAGSGYTLQVDEGDVDASRFESLILGAVGDGSPGDPDGVSRMLTEALGLWRGSPYADVSYEDAVQGEIRRLGELHAMAVEGRLEASLSAGRHREVLGEIEAWAAGHPLREAPQRLLMLALYRCGREADALRAFQDFRHRLAEELGVEPSDRLARLEEGILLHDPALTPDTAPRHNLPAELTRFIGREEALAGVVEALAGARLLTLIGAGGAGKTRLALRAARAVLADFPDGVWLVDMSRTGGEGAAAHVATTLGIPDGAGDGERLAEVLRDRSLLLVLDNCESLTGATAEVARSVLEGASRVRVLATSRVPLGVPGERTWVVPGLGLPDTGIDDPSRIEGSEAVRLFIDRASAARPDFTTTPANASEVAAICRRLDGLPLAIELAAARIKTMTPGQILTGLGDVFHLLSGGGPGMPPHHRTLEATIRWSLQLLSADERTLLERLRIFVWDFPLRAAELMASGDGVDQRDVLDLLTGLIDGGLVAIEEHDGEVHYRLPQTVWWFVRRFSDFDPRIDAPGYVVALAQRTEPRLRGSERQMWSVLLGAPKESVDEMLRVTYQRFTIEAGSFLAGAVAGWTTATGRVGFVGGVDWDLIRRFEHGFTLGAHHVDPMIRVDATYLSTPPDYSGFNNPAGLLTRAEALYAGGADVVFHASGRSGEGLFQAARQASLATGRPHWGIGVDFDEYLEVEEDLKPYVLTSMRKQVPLDVLRRIFDALRSGGEPPALDLENEGVGLSYSGGHVDHLRGRIEALTRRLVAGEIDPIDPAGPPADPPASAPIDGEATATRSQR